MNNLTRRQSIKTIAGGLGATALGTSLFPSLANATPSKSFLGGPKRVVFFLQNQGFPINTCTPTGMGNNGSLASATLPEQVKALQPYREKITIINGLHGTHTAPSHSACFGALGGYRGGVGVPPSASTIDYELSKALPQALMPMLSVGMDSLDAMKAKPSISGLSATGANQPIYMYSNPSHLYQLLYGGLAEGEMKKQHLAKSSMLQKLQKLAQSQGAGLPALDQAKYSRFTRGFEEINDLRNRLDKESAQLAQFAPKVDDRYYNPQFETDWHDTLFELGLSALKAGITNVLTIGSGRGDILGSWKGLGIETQGHSLGHMEQKNNPIWVSIRQYNMKMLVKLIEELENTPEGSGSMMDNTLIVYTSNNGSSQHTSGKNWPFLLIGDCDGAFSTGKFVNIEGRRPINALYATILKTAGVNLQRFNMSEQLASGNDTDNGVLKQILV